MIDAGAVSEAHAEGGSITLRTKDHVLDLELDRSGRLIVGALRKIAP